jgi:hypothetical protein
MRVDEIAMPGVGLAGPVTWTFAAIFAGHLTARIRTGENTDMVPITGHPLR